MKDGQKIIIRKAKIKDLETLQPMYVEFMNYHGRLDPMIKIVSKNKEHVLKYLRNSIYGHKTLYLVAEKEGKIIGFLGAGLSEMPPIYRYRKIGVIYDAFVLKQFRRQGVNSQMLEMAMEWLKEKKVSRVEAGISADNDLALNTWDAHGFKTAFYRKRKMI